VIFLCIATGQFPFFHSPDDQDAIIELAWLFGTEEIGEVAQKYSKKSRTRYGHIRVLLKQLVSFILDRDWRVGGLNCPATRVEWKRLVEHFNTTFASSLPASAYDLLDRCLTLHHTERISAIEALEHPFLKDVS
jgi:cell division control protein 7